MGSIFTLLVLVRHSRVFGHIFGVDIWVLRMKYLLVFCMVCGPRGQSVSVSTGFPKLDAMSSGAHLAPESMCQKHEIK